ncbi:MAG: outer membrane lipoprotein carrier protein LolA [Candidatus Glassbacteria bacterium]
MKVLKKTFTVIALCALAAAGTLPAVEMTTERILEKMGQSNLRLQDLQADFVQTKVLALFDEQLISHGKFYFRNPDKLVLDTTEPEHQQLIINYNHVWLHYPDLKQVHELSLNQAEGLSALFVGFGGAVKDIRDQFNVALRESGTREDGTGYYVLSLEPIPGTPAASPALGLARVLLTVTDRKWYPVRTEIVQKNGDRSILEYSNQKDNLKLSESRFTFKPPVGTQVINHTAGQSGVTQ